MTDVRVKGSAYGKCIVADYNNVSKDKCITEFMKLKECYLVSCSNKEGCIGWILIYTLQAASKKR
jgi:hypothetical protein